ncbi:tannase/feruloyl esterase family alpha/beta hydrolase, partial [Enterobacteriaceae bacterium TzEc077]
MNYTNNKRILTHSALVLAMLGALAGCGSDNDDTTAPSTTKPPQLSPAVGVKMTGSCSDLLGFQYNNTVISSATLQETGTLTVANKPIGAHCLVKGYMDQHVSPVDGQTYQIGFEMRLPIDWNGRFLYQGNGGTDGNLVPATGQVGSG